MKTLRKIYYSLSPDLRLWARKLYYLPDTLFKKREGTIPPKSLIYTGSGDFLKQGSEWKEFFIDNGLQPEHSFLDIGSGIGRIAIGLKDYLKGEYQGFEAMEVGADWCRNNITPKYPNFNFKYVNLHNDLYNSEGLDAAEYVFDYTRDSFDYACAISVFTHMIDTEVANYLEQASKVIKRNGHLVATFFIMDKDTKQRLDTSETNFRFDHAYENYYLMDKKVKGANVCFKKEYLLKIIDASGFEIVRSIPGSWSGIPKISPVAFQDVLVLKRK